MRSSRQHSPPWCTRTLCTPLALLERRHPSTPPKPRILVADSTCAHTACVSGSMPGFSLPGGRLWLVAPAAAAAATAAYASAPPPPPRLRPSERPIVNEKCAHLHALWTLHCGAQLNPSIDRRSTRRRCVQRLLAEPGAKAVPSGGQMLRRHGIIGRLIAQDHWVRRLVHAHRVAEPAAAQSA